MAKKKYFKTKAEAVKACKEYQRTTSLDIRVFKMVKGTRKAGWFAVCTFTEWLNTY